MGLFKCKMCGGDLEIAEGVTIAECDYCGTKQTVPKAIDENLQNLFNRANTLRIKSEFDKAEKLYEKIIQADSTQSEAYWGLILCKYGIEYVDDPSTFKKIPTCHRASYDSIIADDDYKSALENADMHQRIIYEAQAREIDRIQKDILALAQKEETYDVFICYKETDAEGKRTQDSVIANDIYYQLTNEGFKVFYAAITLEGKLGSAYEPIIFAALNSAKVMLSIGTKPEYFNAVWVKNEWSRFLKIIKKDRTKLLIPCYRGMDAYELPEEFAHLQAQDMSKIGFINDIVRGIKKVIKKDEPKPATVVKETVVSSTNTAVAPLLKRTFIFLEDGDWSSADEYCEKVLDIEPENAEAYLGKLMAELHIRKKEQLKNCDKPFDKNNNFAKIQRFGDDKIKNELAEYIQYIINRNENARLEGIYSRAASLMASNSSDGFISASGLFASISDYKDSASMAIKCKDAVYDMACNLTSSARYNEAITEFQKIYGYRDSDERIKECEKFIKESIYDQGLAIMGAASTIHQYQNACKIFNSIISYRDSGDLAAICMQRITELKIEAQNEEIYKKATQLYSKSDKKSVLEAIAQFETLNGWRDSEECISRCHIKLDEIEERLKKAKIERERKQKQAKKTAIIVIIAIAALIAAYFIVTLFVIPYANYNSALSLMDDGKYAEAIVSFEELGGFLDSESKIDECNAAIIESEYVKALSLMDSGKYDDASAILNNLGSYKNTKTMLSVISGIERIKNNKIDSALRAVIDAGAPVRLVLALNGGTHSDGSEIELKSYSQYASLANPTREGYKFVEWQYTDYSYSVEDSLKINLSAVWSDEYTITYNLAGGVASNPHTYHKDGAAVTLNPPTRTGYTFTGWTGSGLSGLTMDVTIPAGSYGDKSYTANWKVGEYTITLNASGGVLEGEKMITGEFNSQYTLPSPTREHYIFAGWYNGNDKYTDGTWIKAENVTLTAKWTPRSYSISYNMLASNATNNSGNPIIYTIESDEIIPKNPTRPGYNFLGWYRNSSHTVKVTSIPTGSYGDITLYARWEPSQIIEATGSEVILSTKDNVASIVVSSESTYVMPSSSEVKITAKNSYINCTYEIVDSVKIDIDKYPVILVLTKDFCTCDDIKSCYATESVAAHLMTGNNKEAAVNNKTPEFSICWEPLSLDYGSNKGQYLYFMYNSADNPSFNPNGRVNALQLDFTGIRYREPKCNNVDIVFVGFFKSYADAENYVYNYLGIRH